MHSFSAMRKVEKENKNTSPRTAPAMSCSRLKIKRSPIPFEENWLLFHKNTYMLLIYFRLINCCIVFTAKQPTFPAK